MDFFQHDDFHQPGSLGLVSYRVAMPVCLSVSMQVCHKSCISQLWPNGQILLVFFHKIEWICMVTCDLGHMTHVFFKQSPPPKKCLKVTKRAMKKQKKMDKSAQNCRIVSTRRDFILSMQVCAKAKRGCVSRMREFFIPV